MQFEVGNGRIPSLSLLTSLLDCFVYLAAQTSNDADGSDATDGATAEPARCKRHANGGPDVHASQSVHEPALVSPPQAKVQLQETQEEEEEEGRF